MIFKIIIFAMIFPYCLLSVEFDAAEILLSNCHHIHSEINYPNEFDRISTNISLSLYIDRFSSINDIDESFEMFSNFYTRWHNKCVENVMKNETIWPKEIQILYNLKHDRFWTPDFIHKNTRKKSSTFAKDSDKRLNIEANGMFSFMQIGNLISYCDFDFLTFPFDQQHCNVTFSLLQPQSHLSINEAVAFLLSNTAMPRNFNWNVQTDQTAPQISTYICNGVGDEMCPEIHFRFIFTRKSFYYTCNLFAPAVILSVLLLVAFFLPPMGADRATFAATIMLSLFLLQTDMMSYIPETPVPIIAALYVLAVTCYCAVIVIYSAILSYVCYTKPKIIEKSIRFCGTRVSIVQIVDFIALIITIAILSFQNFATIVSIGRG